MRRFFLGVWWAALVASAACARADAQTVPPDAGVGLADGKASDGPAGGGLAASLRKSAAGGPVVLVLADRAIEARSADGAFKTQIVPGPINQALYDAELELLWVRRHHRLEVWDLRQDKPRATPILVDSPDLGDFAVVRGEHAVHQSGTCIVPGTTTVVWDKRPSVKVEGFDEMDTPPHPQLEGAAWLTSQYHRPLRKVSLTRATLPAVAGQGARVGLPHGVGKCPDKNECGSGVAFGSTGWTLVVGTEDAGSDCQHYRCLLYDPQAKAFGKPPLPSQWKPEAQRTLLADCGLYRFEVRGKWFAIDDQLCGVGGTCSKLGKSAQVIGWLDGENDVGTDE